MGIINFVTGQLPPLIFSCLVLGAYLFCDFVYCLVAHSLCRVIEITFESIFMMMVQRFYFGKSEFSCDLTPAMQLNFEFVQKIGR